MVVQLATQRTKEDNFLMLDFDVASVPQRDFPGIDSVRAWLDAAHAKIDEAFLAAINPKMLEKWKRGEEK